MRNHNTLTRAKIIEEVAKCVPTTCKVDLEDPEVFILMEFCPGGGIIDMMNCRLRERLTEPEILRIFVDVCEALAFMLNLRPALLHRDLKVRLVSAFVLRCAND